MQAVVIRERVEWNVPEPKAPGEGPQLPPGSPYPQTAVLINSQSGSVSRLACQGREAVDIIACGYEILWALPRFPFPTSTVGSQLTMDKQGWMGWSLS